VHHIVKGTKGLIKQKVLGPNHTELASVGHTDSRVFRRLETLRRSTAMVAGRVLQDQLLNLFKVL
jgi:hypothetical protein